MAATGAASSSSSRTHSCVLDGRVPAHLGRREGVHKRVHVCVRVPCQQRTYDVHAAVRRARMTCTKTTKFGSTAP
eukprot:366143-Chlamydomonas_euryale.AAC.6